MGKRVPQDERPYRPVEEALVRAVMSPQEGEGIAEANVGELPRTNGLSVSLPVDSSSEGSVSPRVSHERKEVAQAPSTEKLTREKRVLLTLSEEREIERLVARIADELGTPVKFSHLLRAYMTLLLHAENEIMKRARQVGALHRPSNGDPVALVKFEQRLAQILSVAFQDTSPIR